MSMSASIRQAVVAAALGSIGTVAAPADAHTDGCVFQGLMTTTSPPAAGVSVGWNLVATVVGTCASSPSFFTFHTSGQLTGAIVGTTTGTGTTATGHRFAFTGAGGTTYLAGEVVGSFVLTPDPQTSTGTRLIVNAIVGQLH